MLLILESLLFFLKVLLSHSYIMVIVKSNVKLYYSYTDIPDKKQLHRISKY